MDFPDGWHLTTPTTPREAALLLQRISDIAAAQTSNELILRGLQNLEAWVLKLSSDATPQGPTHHSRRVMDSVPIAGT